jgi:hypothetical protein
MDQQNEHSGAQDPDGLNPIPKIPGNTVAEITSQFLP